MCGGLPFAECPFPLAAVNDTPCRQNGRRLVELQLIASPEVESRSERQGNGDLPLAGNCRNHGAQSKAKK